MLLFLKKISHYYKLKVIQNCVGKDVERKGLNYWQNRLFASIMMYVVPLSLLAVIPGVIMSIAGGTPELAVFDFAVFFLLFFVTFYKNLSVTLRKSLFILVIYICAVVLLYFLGTYGPGLLYLMAVTIFTILIFNRRIAYWSVAANTFTCVVFGFAIYFEKIDSIILSHHSIGAWIAVASNLIVLSIIIAALLPTIFKGMQNTIEEQNKLRMQLTIEQRSLHKTLQAMHSKNQELEEFAYMTSHDLQEPLRMVSGFLGQLQKNYSSQLDDKALQYIYLAADGAHRMKKTILDLLNYSMAEKKANKIERVDVNSIIINYIAQHKDSISEKNYKITRSDLPMIEADKLSMEQLFQNLIGNALKYQRRGNSPHIHLSHLETKRYWQFAVSDNGIGIDKKEIDNIFILFKRLHDKTEYEGTGIGLAICKKIVENHRGKIWVESEPEKGSTFYFTISKNLQS